MNSGSSNWNNGPPRKNWEGGPSSWTSGNSQGRTSMRSSGNSLGRPSNNKWSGGPTNINNGPKGNWNAGPPSGNWNAGPPSGNWNNGPPNGNRNGLPQNGNWNSGPPNGNRNSGPPNNNWKNGPQNNGPPNGNWNNGPPPYSSNGPPYGPWNQAPPFPGPGLPLLDPDLPDGLDTMYQRMQAMQAMHEMNQYASKFGGLDIIPPMAFPHPVPAPGMAPRIPGSGPQTGFPQRPHTRVGVWTGTDPKSANSTGNITMAFTRRNSAQSNTLRPKLAEFQHQGRIGWGNGNETTNSTSMTGRNQSQIMTNPRNYLYNPYSYGFNGFGFNPWTRPYKPDTPDHLENRKNNEKNAQKNQPSYNPAPPSGWAPMPRDRLTGLTSNQTRQPEKSEIMSQGVKNIQRIQSETRGWPPQPQANTNPGRPPLPQRYDQWTPSSRRQNWNPHGTMKPDPDGGKQGDVEKEVEKEKEEGITKTNINVVKAVLNEVYRQRDNKDLSVASIMDAINNRETRYKMQYRYEGNVPPPPWTKHLETVKAQKKGPTPRPAEVVAEDVKRISIPRTGASFRFSSKYIPRNMATMIQNQTVQPNQNPRAQPNQNTVNMGWPQTPPITSNSPSGPVTPASVFKTQDIVQQAIGIAQHPGNVVSAKSNNSQTIPDLAPMLGEMPTTTGKVITLNVDTEIQVQKGDQVHMINHEQVITVPINRTTPVPLNPNHMGVTMAVVERWPEMSTPPDSVQKAPIPTEASLSPSSTFGIIVGIIIGFTIILGPILCIICRVRRKHREKKRRLSAKQSGFSKGDVDAMETMISCDFGESAGPSSGISFGAKAKVKSFLTRPASRGKAGTELQTIQPKSQTTTAVIH